MPALLAPFVGFALGATFAHLVSAELRAQAPSFPVLWRMWTLVCLFALLVFGPVTGYFLAYETDWAYAYLLDPAQRSSALSLALIVVSVTSVPFGFGAGSWAARHERPPLTLGLMLGPALLAIGGALVLAKRLSMRGTFAQFHGNFGLEPLSRSSLGYALLWMLAVLGLAASWTAHALWRLNGEAR